jgi:hypothetical protein
VNHEPAKAKPDAASLDAAEGDQRIAKLSPAEIAEHMEQKKNPKPIVNEVHNQVNGPVVKDMQKDTAQARMRIRPRLSPYTKIQNAVSRSVIKPMINKKFQRKSIAQKKDFIIPMTSATKIAALVLKGNKRSKGFKLPSRAPAKMTKAVKPASRSNVPWLQQAIAPVIPYNGEAESATAKQSVPSSVGESNPQSFVIEEEDVDPFNNFQPIARPKTVLPVSKSMGLSRSGMPALQTQAYINNDIVSDSPATVPVSNAAAIASFGHGDARAIVTPRVKTPIVPAPIASFNEVVAPKPTFSKVGEVPTFKEYSIDKTKEGEVNRGIASVPPTLAKVPDIKPFMRSKNQTLDESIDAQLRAAIGAISSVKKVPPPPMATFDEVNAPKPFFAKPGDATTIKEYNVDVPTEDVSVSRDEVKPQAATKTNPIVVKPVPGKPNSRAVVAPQAKLPAPPVATFDEVNAPKPFFSKPGDAATIKEYNIDQPVEDLTVSRNEVKPQAVTKQIKAYPEIQSKPNQRASVTPQLKTTSPPMATFDEVNAPKPFFSKPGDVASIKEYSLDQPIEDASVSRDAVKPQVVNTKQIKSAPAIKTVLAKQSIIRASVTQQVKAPPSSLATFDEVNAPKPFFAKPGDATTIKEYNVDVPTEDISVSRDEVKPQAASKASPVVAKPVPGKPNARASVQQQEKPLAPPLATFDEVNAPKPFFSKPGDVASIKEYSLDKPTEDISVSRDEVKPVV